MVVGKDDSILDLTETGQLGGVIAVCLKGFNGVRRQLVCVWVGCGGEDN